MLSRAEAAELLNTAATAGSETRLRLLSRLLGELPPSLWPDFGRLALRVAQVPPGTARRRELIELMARLPIVQKYAVLFELARDRTDPDDATVMSVLLSSLTRDGFPPPVQLFRIRDGVARAGRAGRPWVAIDFEASPVRPVTGGRAYERIDGPPAVSGLPGETAGTDEVELSTAFEDGDDADGGPSEEGEAHPAGLTPTTAPSPVHPVYPRLDAPERAAPGAPFVVTAGLRADQDTALVGPTAVRLPRRPETLELQVAFQFDPHALVLLPEVEDHGRPLDAEQPGVYSLRRTPEDPWPSVSVTFVGLARPDLTLERRIDVSFIRDGALIGFASRSVVIASDPRGLSVVPAPPEPPADPQHPRSSGEAGETAGQVSQLRPRPSSEKGSEKGPEKSPAPAVHPPWAPTDNLAVQPGPTSTDRFRPSTALDLTPLLDADRPDLLIVIRRSDEVSGTRLVFTAFSRHEHVADQWEPRTEVIVGEAGVGTTPHELGAQARAKVATTGNQLDLYAWLLGLGHRIYRSVPAPIRAALRATVASGTPEHPATVLVLSDEPYVPWELAARPAGWSGAGPHELPPGGEAVFLGAHVAISRWLLTDEPPPAPRPQSILGIGSTAVVTARYEGLLGADPLPHAELEAARLIEALAPDVVAVRPLFTDVLNLLGGSPAVDLMHFALHGRFDPLGVAGGLLLPPERHRAGRMGLEQPDILHENHIRGRRLTASPFVYLNACQIGAGDGRLLGDYGGMAAAFLEAGAGAVVAPLWNIADHTAAEMAEEFYRHCLEVAFPDAEPAVGRIPVAELLRRIRARYTERAVRQEAPGIDATLVSFQLFGHPRLRLLSATKGH